MMAALRCCVGLLLAFTPTLVATQTSFLQQNRRQQAGALRSSGDWDEGEVRLCTFGAKAESDNPIKVFADTEENTRHVSFAREGFATDDGFVESMQKCKGPFPDICKQKNTNGTSSGCASCPCELDTTQPAYGNYQRRMLELLVPQCQAASAKEAFHVLLVGLGGGALVQYILGQCPKGTVVEAIEYDPRMIEIATRFFGLTASASVFKTATGDGGAVVAAHVKEGRTYNMVLVDAFAGGSHVPESCRDAAFTGNLHHILRKGGSVLHNMAGPTYGNLAGPDDYKTTVPHYEESFGKSFVKLETLTGNLEFPSHLIVAQVPSK